MTIRDALDGDGDSLPLLDTETNVVDSDEGVLDVGQLEKVDDLVDVGHLLLLQGRKHTASEGDSVRREKLTARTLGTSAGCRRRALNSKASRTVW